MHLWTTSWQECSYAVFKGRAVSRSAQRLVLIPLLLTIGLILRFQFYPAYKLPAPRFWPSITTNQTTTTNQELPRKIWQTWMQRLGSRPAQGMKDETRGFIQTWIAANPLHGYELLTDETARKYVRDRFRQQPDILRTFERIAEPILRADYIRYLALLGDGGVYSDVDTECKRKIDDWVPQEYKNVTGLVVGVEYDSLGGPVRTDMNIPVQLCQYTIMAKPGHPVMQHVVDSVTAALQKLGGIDEKISLPAIGDVLEVTGPRMFTRAILESLSELTGQNVTYANLTMLGKPKLIGDVLVLPVSAFGSGQRHSGSKPLGNAEQLIRHHFKGFETWKKGNNWKS